MAGRTYSKELRDAWLQAGNVWLDVEKKLYDLRIDGCT
jgi:hypothetical protein